MSAQPRPSWEAEFYALCDEEEALTRRIEALKAQRKLIELKKAEVLRG